MRRSLAVVIVAVAALALVVGGCGGGEDLGKIVRAAATKTAAAESSRLSLTVATSAGGQKTTFTGTGAFDYAAKRGTFTLDLSGVPQAAGFGLSSVDAVVDGLVYYVRFPDQLASQFFDGKPWLRFDLAALAKASAGLDLGQLSEFGQSDPTQALQYLRGASDDVHKVGSEHVRGVGATHYRATLDLKKAGAQLSGDAKAAYDKAIATLGATTLPADVWVDAQGRARKLRFQPPASPTSSKSKSSSLGTTTVTVELFDFGVAVDAQPPPADQVSDLGALLDGAAGSGQAG